MEQRSMQGELLTVHLSQAEEYSYSTPIPLYLLSCVSGVHLTLNLFCRCTTEVVLLQQGVLLGSLWEDTFSKLSRLYLITLHLAQSSQGSITLTRICFFLSVGALRILKTFCYVGKW